MDLSYAFTIFFLTLGPLKVIPGFYMVTLGMDTGLRKKLAIRGALYALFIILAVAFISNFIANAWRISLDAFILAGGIILFLSSFKLINKFTLQSPNIPDEQIKDLPPKKLKLSAISPVAIPVIISPIAIVAVMSTMLISEGDFQIESRIFGLLALMMVLNFMGMWFVRPILKSIGMPVFSVIGWVFSILQAGLAIQFIINSLSKIYPF